MYRQIFTISALSLSIACAPAAPEDGTAEYTAKVLAQSLTDAILYGEFSQVERIVEEDFRGGTAHFVYEDDSPEMTAWWGRVSGDAIWSQGEEEIEHDYDVVLYDFGRQSEHFGGGLDITRWQRLDEDKLELTFDGDLESSVNGEIDLDLKVEVEASVGYLGIEWTGTVNGIVVSGHSEQKQDIEELENEGCKGPIGVDCE